MFKISIRLGPRLGVGIGGTTDGFAPVAPGPGLVFFAGSSGAQGLATATNFTDYPGIDAAYAGFQFMRTGALLSGANGGSWTSETKQDLQPRTTTIGAPYIVGTAGYELKLGRDLDAANANAWGGATFTTDAASLHSTLHFLNPAWPTVGDQWVVRLCTAIQAAIEAHGKPLKVFVWDHGNDASDGTATAAYYTNLVYLFNVVRQRFGNVGIVVMRLSNRSTFGGGINAVRDAMESFAMRPENGRVAVTYIDECSLRDTAHLADDAAGVLGYCEAGKRLAVAVIAAANDTVHPTTSPWWGVQAVPQVAGSTAFANPIPYPNFYGSANNKADIGVLWYSGAGNTPITAPTGWTQVTGSPVWGGAVTDARLHVFTRTLQSGDTPPTIADVAGDGEKSAGIFVIRNSSGLDVNPTTATVPIAAPSASVSWPAITPASTNCLIVHILAHGIDAATPQLGGLTNAGLTGLIKHVDYCSVTNSGTGCVVGAGVRASATDTGATTGTLLAADTQALMTLAFKL